MTACKPKLTKKPAAKPEPTGQWTTAFKKVVAENDSHDRARNANETLRIGLLMTAAGKNLPQGAEKMLEAAVAFLHGYYGEK